MEDSSFDAPACNKHCHRSSRNGGACADAWLGDGVGDGHAPGNLRNCGGAAERSLPPGPAACATCILLWALPLLGGLHAVCWVDVVLLLIWQGHELIMEH